MLLRLKDIATNIRQHRKEGSKFFLIFFCTNLLQDQRLTTLPLKEQETFISGG
ncbi:hypothetical protein GIB67_014964, partial [Kingdonia uniflora]